MRFTPEFLDELRSRLPVSDVVGRRVKLRKAGREWKGLSPFNKEKTPSFFVNDQKQAWFDFSSGRNGSIFDFIMAVDGVSFPEAVERLAAEAGLPLPQVSPEAEARDRERKTLHEVMELAAKFFEGTLAARAGARGRGYLADRGIEPATQLEFRLGYAPTDRFALKEHLGGHGVSVPDMIDAGLLIHGDDIPVPFDRFRDRVMFPIADFRGRVVAFGGRALDKNANAKYLNSPETKLYHKGSVLYNGASARAAAHQGAPLIAVEGYIDVIAMVRAGFPATVAPLGTALTEDQMKLLWSIADEPVLCFDGDGAGRRAAYRAADLALPKLEPGKSLKFALLPEGQDPDDLARSGGREALDEVLSAARPLADLVWQRETEGGGFETPERRAALEARLAEITAGITNESVRRYYRQDLEARLRALFTPSRAPARAGGDGRGDFRSRGHGFRRQEFGPKDFGRGRGGRPPSPREALRPLSPRFGTSPVMRNRSGFPAREALILRAVVNHPWLLEAHAEELAELEFRHPDADRLRRAMLDASAGHEALTHDGLASALDASGLAPMLARMETSVTHGSDWPARAGASADDVARWWHHVVTLHRKSRTLHKELREAEQALGTVTSEENFARLLDVQEQLAGLDGMEAEIEGFGASSGRLRRTF